MTESPAIARWCAAALLVLPDGRYLMQLRDAKPGLFLADHWAFFGGSVDPGENAEQAVRRELQEELELTARDVTPLTEMLIDLPMTPARRDRMSFFAVPIEIADIAAMVQHEGADMRLFTIEELAGEQRVAPWDLAAVIMHARRRQLFGD